MSQQGCWADEIAIENFTHLVQRPIFMFQVGQDLPYIFGEDYSSRDPLVIAHVNSRGDDRDVHHHFVSVRNRDTNDKNTPDFEVVKNGPDPKFAPPVLAPRAGEVRGGRLIVVLDTNSIQHVPKLEDFETLYDVIVKARLQDRVKIMVPVAVHEELNRQKQSGDDDLRRRARRFFTFKVDNPKYRKVFRNQNQVMIGAVDVSIVNLCRTAYYRTLPDRNDRNDGRIQGAVEHLMMMGDHVILFSDDSTIIDGCRSMVPDTADIGRLRESPSFYPRGQLRVVLRKHFIDIIDGLKMGDVPKGRTDTTVTKAQRQTLRDLRDGRAQLTIEVLLSLFNP
jgi:hypothetical protein